MTIGVLPDAVEPGVHYALDPGFHGVPPVRHARTVMLVVPVGRVRSGRHRGGGGSSRSPPDAWQRQHYITTPAVYAC
jgi:hypothetical protein